MVHGSDPWVTFGSYPSPSKDNGEPELMLHCARARMAPTHARPNHLEPGPSNMSVMFDLQACGPFAVVCVLS